jgi:biopolymer transport protein ExbB/TolQ
MTNRLVEWLYFLSSGLLLPVLVVLLGCMASSLLTLGGLIREAIDRRRVNKSWRAFLTRVRGDMSAVREFYQLHLTGYPAIFQREAWHNQLATKKTLDDLEITIGKRLAHLSVQTRVGPMLGLVGTLLPLGPALTGLATGNVQTLAGNLVIAFTTTTFGILVGAFSYAVSLIRHGWYEQDMSDLEFVVAAIQASMNDDEAFTLSYEEAQSI